MVIDFSVGNFIVINRAFVEKVLPTIDCLCNKQTITTLGYIGANPSEVLAVGSTPLFGNEPIKSFVRVQPVNDPTNPIYKVDETSDPPIDVGTIIYFCSDAHLNNSLELSNAYIDDKCHVKCLNSTGSTITKGSLVRQISFDVTQQLPTIGLASAAAAGTSAVLGIASADILNGECGSIIISGSFCGLDTSGFSVIGDKVFLGNTGGTIGTAAGTVETIVGRILSISATVGCLSLVESLGGSGGGGGFFSDGVGTNAAIGKGTVAPTAGGENALAQGDNCVASANNTFAQGDACTASGESSFTQGRGNTATLPGTFIQGINNYDNYGGSQSGYGNCFFQGQNNRSYQEYKNDFIQGDNNFCYGEYNSNYGINFVQGKNNKCYYNTYSFLQGYNNYLDGVNRGFAQGQSAFVDNDDKKTWGSNRNVLGAAQSSRIIKHVTTTTASATNIASIRRVEPSPADRAVTYAIRAVIVGRNTTTTADNVIFTLDRALAYAATTFSTLTLNGTPTFTQEATAGAASTAATISVSGGTILIRVTGEAGQTYQWVLDAHFLEVTA